MTIGQYFVLWDTFPEAVRKYIATPRGSLVGVLEEGGCTIVTGTDNMAHVMKGNIGLFLSSAANVHMERVRVHGVENQGRSQDQGHVLSREPVYRDLWVRHRYHGNKAADVVLAGTHRAQLMDVKVRGVVLANGPVYGYKLIGDNAALMMADRVVAEGVVTQGRLWPLDAETGSDPVAEAVAVKTAVNPDTL